MKKTRSKFRHWIQKGPQIEIIYNTYYIYICMYVYKRRKENHSSQYVDTKGHSSRRESQSTTLATGRAWLWGFTRVTSSCRTSESQWQSKGCNASRLCLASRIHAHPSPNRFARGRSGRMLLFKDDPWQLVEVMAISLWWTTSWEQIFRFFPQSRRKMTDYIRNLQDLDTAATITVWSVWKLQIWDCRHLKISVPIWSSPLISWEHVGMQKEVAMRKQRKNVSTIPTVALLCFPFGILFRSSWNKPFLGIAGWPWRMETTKEKVHNLDKHQKHTELSSKNHQINQASSPRLLMTNPWNRRRSTTQVCTQQTAEQPRILKRKGLWFRRFREVFQFPMFLCCFHHVFLPGSAFLASCKVLDLESHFHGVWDVFELYAHSCAGYLHLTCNIVGLLSWLCNTFKQTPENLFGIFGTKACLFSVVKDPFLHCLQIWCFLVCIVFT